MHLQKKEADGRVIWPDFFFLCWYTTSKYEVESNIRQQAVLQCFYPSYIEISREFSIGNWFGSEITKTRSMEFVINIHTL